MTPDKIAAIIVSVYLIWLFSDVARLIKRWFNNKLVTTLSAFSFEYERNWEASHEEAEFTNIKNGLMSCTNPILLEKCWDDLIAFKKQYKGLKAEDRVTELMKLYRQKELELSVLN